MNVLREFDIESGGQLFLYPGLASRVDMLSNKIAKTLEGNQMPGNFFFKFSDIFIEDYILLVSQITKGVSLKMFQDKNVVFLDNIYRFDSIVSDFIKIIKNQGTLSDIRVNNNELYKIILAVFRKIAYIITDPECTKFVKSYLRNLLKNLLPFIIKPSSFTIKK